MTESTLRLIEDQYAVCLKMARLPYTEDVEEVRKIILAYQLLGSHVPALIKALREARGIPEPAEPVPFPVDRSRR